MLDTIMEITPPTGVTFGVYVPADQEKRLKPP